MTTIRIIALLLICVTQTLIGQKDQDVLMTVGNADVTVQEFRYIYEKNNGEQADYSKESLDEYLDLYKKFKLKVQKAKAMRLDTVTELNNELDGYRKQLASSFLADKEVIGLVVDEVHDRKKQDVEVDHILIKVKPTAPDAKKKEAEEQILEYRKQIESGTNFGKIAFTKSEDANSAKRRGYLGFTAAMLPNGFYELETALYESPEGQLVGPVWSKLGCHLLKVRSKRPARGVIKVAHLLVKAKSESAGDVAAAEAKVDSLYELLQNDGDWTYLVKNHSEDKKTSAKDGELPIFGIATYERTFEDAAFGLTQKGQFAEPIKSRSGYHIIKLIEKVPPETKEEIKSRLKDKIKTYDRYAKAEERLIESIKKESDYKENRAELDKFIKTLSTDFYSYKWKPETAPTGTLIVIDDKNVSMQEFSDYAKKNIRRRSQFGKDKPLGEAVSDMFDEFSREVVIDYEERNLEKKYPAFRSLMREYQEGILLFEATKIAVWDKANQDSVGLKKFYEKNKRNFKHDERAVVGTYMISTESPKVLKKVQKCVKKNSADKTIKRFNKNGMEVVKYSERTVDADDEIFDGDLEMKKGSLSETIKDSKRNIYVLSKVVDVKEPRIKELSEARGYVVADYQDQLEKNWINELQKEFPINVNEKIYRKMIKK